MSFQASGNGYINQWLGMAFIGLVCFWVVLYYFVNKTQDVGSNLKSLNISYNRVLESQ